MLARAKLTPASSCRLADALKTAGPLEVDRLLAAFEQSTDEALGLKLVKALGESSALPACGSTPSSSTWRSSARQSRPRRGALRPAQRRRRQAEGQARGADDQSPAGDVRRGQLVFNSEKAACFTCHAIGYRGGNVGPDLTKIGQVRTERDLLEAILFPSASFVRSYEPVVVATTDGKVLNGCSRTRPPTRSSWPPAPTRRRGSPEPTSRRSGPAPSRSCPPASTSSSPPGARRPGRVPEGVPVEGGSRYRAGIQSLITTQPGRPCSMSSGHALAIGQVSKSLVIGDLGAEILIPLFLSQVAIGDLAGAVLPV